MYGVVAIQLIAFYAFYAFYAWWLPIPRNLCRMDALERTLLLNFSTSTLSLQVQTE
jgi:hypothetical protein